MAICDGSWLMALGVGTWMALGVDTWVALGCASRERWHLRPRLADDLTVSDSENVSDYLSENVSKNVSENVWARSSRR